MRFRHFLNDRRGSSFESIALSVAVIAVGFVASADMLDYLTKPERSDVAVAKAPPSIAQKNLDYTPTASVPKLISRSILDPCTGARK